MTPATPWTELEVTGVGWQMGFPIPGGNEDDFYIDFLFDGASISSIVPTDHTELTVAVTSYTELSVAATVWTELV